MQHTLDIDGMSCQHCVRAVREALDSIAHLKVDGVDIGSARVSGPAEAAEAARRAVEEEGYPVTALRSS